jgi:hypothetical protein
MNSIVFPSVCCWLRVMLANNLPTRYQSNHGMDELRWKVNYATGRVYRPTNGVISTT